jgi:hypothetical protein
MSSNLPSSMTVGGHPVGICQDVRSGYLARGAAAHGRTDATGQRGGTARHHVVPAPYTKNPLVNDFDKVRMLAFGLGSPPAFQGAALWRSRGRHRRRRSRASVEQDGQYGQRQRPAAKTFNPVNVASARRFNEARAKGTLDSGTAAVRKCHIGPLRQPLTAVKPAKSLK